MAQGATLSEQSAIPALVCARVCLSLCVGASSLGCLTEADARLKIKTAIVTILFWCLPNVPCATRWLTCTGSLGWFLIGCLINRLFIRGFKLAFDKSADVLNVNDLGGWAAALGADGSGDLETANDEWHQRLGKRLRRGARFFGDILCSAKIAFSLLILLPLHFLMTGFFKESSKKDASVNEIMSKANRCADRVTQLLHNDVLSSKEWLLMRCADGHALHDLEFRKHPVIKIPHKSI